RPLSRPRRPQPLARALLHAAHLTSGALVRAWIDLRLVDEPELGRPPQIDALGEAASEEAGRSDERALDGGARAAARDREVNARELAVAGERDARQLHALELGIGDVVSKDEGELLQDGALDTLVPCVH